MEKLGTKKIDMQKVLAPAALVILYIFFSIFGTNFFSVDYLVTILESSYYIGFMAFGVTFIIITGGIDLSLGTVMMCAALLGAYTFKLGCICPMAMNTCFHSNWAKWRASSRNNCLTRTIALSELARVLSSIWMN